MASFLTSQKRDPDKVQTAERDHEEKRNTNQSGFHTANTITLITDYNMHPGHLSARAVIKVAISVSEDSMTITTCFEGPLFGSDAGLMGSEVLHVVSL